MYHGDNEPTEVLHIYVVRVAVRPPLLSIFLSVLALSVFGTFGALSPNQQPVARAVIRVPAVPLVVKTFTAQIAIIPTGIKVYPATTAHGVLTITNGSVISQTIPAGFKFLTNRGIEVITDSSVFVPQGDASSYGSAAVSAHALIPGKGGNLATLAINQVIGSSVYVRNLSAFSGGKDAYAVKVATAQDKRTALLHARGILLNKSSGLHYPCIEDHNADARKMTVAWRCQFVMYQIPTFYHVTGVRLAGKSLLLDVWFVPRPAHIWVK